IEDYLDKVTHIIRSNEFKNSVQNLIREYLNFTKPTIIQYARFNFEGTPFSKRKIRELISQGKISSWEDLRLPTMSSIERRGILPQAIKEFVIRNGYSESSHTYEWESLLTLNRKILDPISKRLFFVIDPVKININYDGEIEIPYHPTQNLGKRKIKVNGFVYISKNDLEYDKLLRLKDFVSVRINKDNTAVIVSKEKIGNEKIIQWVGNDFLNAKLVKINELLKGEDINPESLKEYDGFLESNGSLLSEGEIVQFERIGFARLDNKEKNVFIYSC
ncbi:MAG: glutamate--tRNA ligase family protein, partial [Candidatus Rehaiarchaeum fermentans]|nr:glutamate--tRNA ligase family protein [Candidatus Rehaiarchaeum fermentans]